jgi:PIN domain nuclease of toxin-antitoxin system
VSVLLDTHYVYALTGAPGRLSKKETEFLSNHPEPFRVSAVSIWEMRLKWAALFVSGARKGPIDPAQALQLLSTQAIVFLSLSPAHAASRLQTPITHNDPFDELLLVQAQNEGLKLLTRDRNLKAHPLALSVP